MIEREELQWFKIFLRLQCDRMNKVNIEYIILVFLIGKKIWL